MWLKSLPSLAFLSSTNSSAIVATCLVQSFKYYCVVFGECPETILIFPVSPFTWIIVSLVTLSLMSFSNLSTSGIVIPYKSLTITIAEAIIDSVSTLITADGPFPRLMVSNLADILWRINPYFLSGAKCRGLTPSYTFLLCSPNESRADVTPFPFSSQAI